MQFGGVVPVEWRGGSLESYFCHVLGLQRVHGALLMSLAASACFSDPPSSSNETSSSGSTTVAAESSTGVEGTTSDASTGAADSSSGGSSGTLGTSTGFFGSSSTSGSSEFDPMCGCSGQVCAQFEQGVPNDWFPEAEGNGILPVLIDDSVCEPDALLAEIQDGGASGAGGLSRSQLVSPGVEVVKDGVVRAETRLRFSAGCAAVPPYTRLFAISFPSAKDLTNWLTAEVSVNQDGLRLLGAGMTINQAEEQFPLATEQWMVARLELTLGPGGQGLLFIDDERVAEIDLPAPAGSPVGTPEARLELGPVVLQPLPEVCTVVFDDAWLSVGP